MLDKIIQFSIAKKLIIGLFTLGLVCWGVYSLNKLPIDAVPDITDNQVMVITVSPTLAAQEVEQLVTFPVEQTMVSIPNIQEMRSFSRFGLSIVTIVFDEKVDIYWGRQQVQERLSIAEKEIPLGVGKPEMAPVTTGLGEIYQYVVHTKEGYEDKYDATELRTIQDWIIKRQLLGTPGVAEVSGFGGYVKQYEIAFDPDRLKSLGVTISDVFTALERNNQNTGGAYIDKGPNAYFIRSEGLIKSLNEINAIVVKNNNSGPLLIRDIATVQFGSGTRYGAATRNGEGEVVTGIVMMLKGANSSEVITNVKEKIKQIEKTLPEGVTIEPYLDRKKLVDGAIGTVTKNLAEGALIVIFVLILFLGNLRGGLVVASVIPLSMLFAVSMMNLFGISGNLMSLGAIDFGLIVDGAIIIVEAVMHGIVIGKKKYKGLAVLSQKQMDQEVYRSAKRIRSSAAFGEIIILIVYLPLWTLVGVEGKMFTPMAQTVSFAILGAFILSLTYVPMMSALVLCRKTEHKPNFSDRMMDVFQRIYRKVLLRMLRHKLMVVSISAFLFVASLITFMNMGSEFIPQLDEGDFAVETRVPVGSSINQMIDVSNKAQKILLREYPEVNQVVNKIGSGEIPTDPMPIEAGDMMVILKPRKEWTSADTREELIEKMQESLSVIPNATFSFQQPIQMRFNELLTGAKQDVVIKIYGENLETLSDLARNVGQRIRGIEGVEDLYIEKITGLPQIQIDFKREKIAEYGLDVQDVNDAIEVAFAGKTAGLVYEGERRFDLVVRLNKNLKSDIEDVQNLYISTNKGNQIPLSEVAEVSFEPGPVQIQRDNAKRRITLGFNVRNRDVKSIVSEIKNVVGDKITMPSGYYISYGGQFKNLEEANKRLLVAVPVALLLILVLLYFTFGSIKQSLLIFTAIPLSAIGGVFALILRGMPFSISAGVGFIALFGVAVLNGIVMIAEFNRLAKKGIDDLHERVLMGTEIRLRPVLMTALVASLGFLPMAISTTSGAEVQRPLATVVIGGLISATLLTLSVLPILYIYFTRSKKKTNRSKGITTKTIVSVLIILAFGTNVNAQDYSKRYLTEQEAIDIAIKNNGKAIMADKDVQRQQVLKREAFSLPQTEINWTRGKINSPGINDNEIDISQSFSLPLVYSNQLKLAKAKITTQEGNKIIVEKDLANAVKSSFLNYRYLFQKRKLLIQQDSIYQRLSDFSKVRYEVGESTQLEAVTSQTKAMQIKNSLNQITSDLDISLRQLQALLNTSEMVLPKQGELGLREVLKGDRTIGENPLLIYLKSLSAEKKQEISVERSKLLPDFKVGYKDMSFNELDASNRMKAVQLGVSIPLFSGNKTKIKASKIALEKSYVMHEFTQNELESQLDQQLKELSKQNKSVEYFENTALPQARKIMSNTELEFRNGNISYMQHLQNLILAISIENDYLTQVYEYNKTVISIESLIGQ
ncbi:CusA/CzcA family heavy metal efflux RND transporter [Puteibacter caeruleilacunae]|nr:CusA/CzcA family heavy metal efflux RND transporter [Puteibacter caeruleilacunae]